MQYALPLEATMFEIGGKYVITTLEDDFGIEVPTWAVYEVAEVCGDLVRCRRDSQVIILNTASPKFVRAELVSGRVNQQKKTIPLHHMHL
jgi:hypothetical protein